MEIGEDNTLKSTLKKVFGYDTFRGTQEQIIQNVMVYGKHK